tara:strand:- start:121 stop:342 length:222 start_codon:yes stop_codon:yes gene_type:complete
LPSQKKIIHSIAELPPDAIIKFSLLNLSGLTVFVKSFVPIKGITFIPMVGIKKINREFIMLVLNGLRGSVSPV